MKRLVVVGITGSGKTTLARALADRFGYSHIELDALHWDPNWTPAPREVFRARVAEALRAENWVADGNYSGVRDLVWGAADTLIWLDYPLRVTLSRLLRRTLRRGITGEVLWNGNREQLTFLFTKDSLVLWALQTHPRYRREFPVHLARPEFAHLQVIRLGSPRATEAWLSMVPLRPPG